MGSIYNTDLSLPHSTIFFLYYFSFSFNIRFAVGWPNRDINNNFNNVQLIILWWVHDTGYGQFKALTSFFFYLFSPPWWFFPILFLLFFFYSVGTSKYSFFMFHSCQPKPKKKHPDELVFVVEAAAYDCRAAEHYMVTWLTVIGAVSGPYQVVGPSFCRHSNQVVEFYFQGLSSLFLPQVRDFSFLKIGTGGIG